MYYLKVELISMFVLDLGTVLNEFILGFNKNSDRNYDNFLCDPKLSSMKTYSNLYNEEIVQMPIVHAVAKSQCVINF